MKNGISTNGVQPNGKATFETSPEYLEAKKRWEERNTETFKKGPTKLNAENRAGDLI